MESRVKPKVLEFPFIINEQNEIVGASEKAEAESI
jgi:hypothetical protein